MSKTASNDGAGHTESEDRQRCYRCFRPSPLCFCDSVPAIENQVNILILQHVGERFHPFNTARIVRNSLSNCQLIVDNNRRIGQRQLPLQPDAGLLYPAADAPTLGELPADKRPRQLVIIDGTWHQAKTILRDAPQLQQLPCYRLNPESPGQYRIRREPDEQSLSTVEATVSALKALEPETVGLEQLLSAFHQMVDKQLSFSKDHPAWREKRSRRTRPRNVPLALLQGAEHLVVAYGEATPGRAGESPTAKSPVNWVAQRMDGSAGFSSLLRPSDPLTRADLSHMRLATEDFDDAVSSSEFQERWSRYLRPNDVLIVYHQRTADLLRGVQTTQPRCLVLKSILRNWHPTFHSLEELLKLEGVQTPETARSSRAAERLQMAVAMVEHLRRKHQPDS